MNDEQPSTSSKEASECSPAKTTISRPVAVAVKRRRNRQRGKKKLSKTLDDDDDFKIGKRLKQKYLPKKQKCRPGQKSDGSAQELNQPVIRKNKAKSAGPEYEIVNPEAYLKTISRIEDGQANKVLKPDGDIVEGSYLCALCQCGPDRKCLGDLFGPYYLQLTDEFWPPFLKKETSKRSQRATFTDIWIHGFCALWTSGILAKGNLLTGLEEALSDCWQQKCTACQTIGASIGCFVKGCKKAYHYSCADRVGCVLKEDTSTLYCQVHKRLSDGSR